MRKMMKQTREKKNKARWKKLCAGLLTAALTGTVLPPVCADWRIDGICRGAGCPRSVG